MEMMAAFGGGLFVLACLLVGGRLIWLAKSTRGLPEFVLGAGLFLMGGLGYPLMTIAIEATNLPDSTRVAMLAGQMCTTIVGMGGVSWFTRHVFRPNEGWATGLLFAIVGAYLVLAGIQIFGAGIMSFLASPESGAWSTSTAVGTVAMSWAGFESLRYYGMQRRRLALGLADPVVTDRFRLWGVAILSADTMSIMSVICILMGTPITATALGSLMVATLGLLTAGCLALAFVPPQFYVASVRGRAQTTLGDEPA